MDGLLHYREGWSNGSEVTAHWGVCGERGEVRTHNAASEAEADEIIAKSGPAALADGWVEIPEDEHAWLVVEFLLAGLKADDPVAFRHGLEDYLNDLVGWLGLGHCDGGSIGSGTLEAACLVVDYDVAAEALARELKASPYAGYSRIYRE
jgi:hypothetical protein